jgi:hypothetical protein
MNQFAKLLKTISPRRFALAVLGVVFFAFCYVSMSAESAGRATRSFGYWFTFAASVYFVYYLVQVRQSMADFLRGLSRETLAALGGAWLVGCFLLFAHVTFAPKVMMDDTILASTARSLHETREVFVTTYGRAIEGEFTTFEGYIDKRPWLYAFAVSIVHDLSGYRLSNPYIANALFGVAFLASLLILGFKIAKLKGACLLMALWLTIPLLSQNASGSGMDMLNLLMIAVTLLCAIKYLEKPSIESEGLLCLSGVLLAYARYESLLFCGFAVVVVCVGWMRSGRVFLSVGAILSAPLLIGRILQQRYFSDTTALWELRPEQENAFGLSNIVENYPRALNFLFHFGDEMANSWLVSGLGVIALVFLSTRLLSCWKKIPKLNAINVSLLVMGIFLVGHLVVILCYHDGKLDRLFASRFALPFYFLLCLSVVVYLQSFRRAAVVWRPAFVLVAVYMITVSIPNTAKGVFNERNFVVRELEWLESVLSDEMRSSTLLVDKYGIYWALRNISSLPQSRVLQYEERILKEVERGKFSDVIVVDYRETVLNSGAFTTAPSTFSIDSFELELIAEASFKPFEFTRIYRVKGVTPSFFGGNETSQCSGKIKSTSITPIADQ